MRAARLLLGAVLVACASASAALAQTYGQWDVPCETAYTPLFSAPYLHGVYYHGTGPEFRTEWRSVSNVYPLSSLNWYYAYPNRNPVSVNGDYQWAEARILVHCYVVRTPLFLDRARVPVGYSGLLRRVRTSCVGGSSTGGSGPQLAEPVGDTFAETESRAEAVDVNVPTFYGAIAGCGSGGGIYTGATWEGAGGSTCSQQMVRVEVYNEDTESWESFWEGEAVVCV